jgi:outer membrane immunogenic protein
MRYVIAISAVALLGIGSAAADGLPSYSQPPGTSWTGFYVGVHGGYATGNWTGHQTYTDTALVPAVPFGAFDTSSHSIGTNGALAGGQLGYNLQIGRVVIGAEVDGSWANINGNGSMYPYPNDPFRGTALGTPGWQFGVHDDWLTTARLRLGYDANGVLLYGSGGLALGGFHETHTISGYPWNGYSTHDETKSGWTAGAGAEWPLSNHVSLKAEYLYMRFDSLGGTMAWADPSLGKNTDGFKGDLDVHTFKAGLNYKF